MDSLRESVHAAVQSGVSLQEVIQGGGASRGGGDGVELERMTDELKVDWQTMSDRCQSRLEHINRVVTDTQVFNDQLMVGGE